MTIRETGCLFYGVAKHFESNFNFCDYHYKLPESMQKQASNYCSRHKYALDKFACYGRQSIIVFAIVNQLRYRSGDDIEHSMDESDTKWFFGLLAHYKNDFILDIEFLEANITKLRDIYTFHIQEKIKWFTMPILFKHLKYDATGMIDDVPLVKELRWNYRALKLLQLDDEFFKEHVNGIQKKLDLGY